MPQHLESSLLPVISPMKDSSAPGPGISPPHSCQYCQNFALYLYDEPGEIRTDKPTWFNPNRSQTLLAEKIFGTGYYSEDLEERCQEFYRVTDGVSIFDGSLDDLARFSQDGCKFCELLLHCVLKDDDYPSNFVLGARIDTVYSLELGILDLDSLQWETLLGKEIDECPDNSYIMLASPENPARQTIINYPLNPNPSSSLALGQTRSWLKVCQESHRGCPQPSNDFMPTRLIQILSEGGNDFCRLYETHKGNVEPYAALSYCWGGDQTFKTTGQTISHYKKEIKPSDLPQTLQDVIYITKQMGLKYIWIDALCIIQDDDKDKAYEIAQMARVYGNSTVTIAASRAKSVWGGFLSDRKPLGSELPEKVFSLPCYCANGQVGSVIIAPLASERTEYLDLRGWTFQERVLSNRVLDFGSFRTQWICRTNQEAVFSDGWSDRATDSPYGSFGLDTQIVSDLIAGRFPPQDMLNFWNQIVSGFTNRGLTFVEDRLPAIAGMAERFGNILHDQYLAGLWKSGMPVSLLWSNTSGTAAARLSHGHVSAPTWSWASVGASVGYDRQYTNLSENVHFEIEILNCHTSLGDERAPYGAVKSGNLRLKGHAQRVAWILEGNYRGSNILQATDSGISDEAGNVGYEFSKGENTGIGFIPDVLEEEFLKDPNTSIEVCLVLFGTVVFSESSGLFPSIFGLALRSLPGNKYSRIGVFKKTMPINSFHKYMRWFQKNGRESFSVV